MIQNLPYAIGFSLLNLLFLPLNWYMNRKKIQSCVRTNFDDRLPFIPLFYFPYLAFFLMIIFGPYLFALYFPLVIYKPIIVSLLIDMFLSMVIWAIFPVSSLSQNILTMMNTLTLFENYFPMDEIMATIIPSPVPIFLLLLCISFG